MAVWNTIPTSRLVGASRLDAEFWHPTYVASEAAIRVNNHAPLGSLVSVFKKGIFYILAREYSPAGIPFCRSSNVGAVLPKEDGLTFITEAKHRQERKTALVRGDMMMVKTGRSGASVILRDNCNVSQDVVAIKLKPGRVNPYYLAVYLNTAYGSSEMNRWFQGQVQPHLSLNDARRIWVSLPSSDEQQKVERMVLSSANTRDEAARAWLDAQHLLESQLGLDNLTFQKPVGYMARFSKVPLSHTFSARRVDAQCFAPDALFYEQAFSRRGGCESLAYLLDAAVKGRQHEEVSSGTADYCTIKHISGRELANVSRCLPMKGTQFAQREDLLLAITGATIGKVGIVKRYSRLAFSGDLLQLKVNKDVNPYYLLLVLDHSVGQIQFNRWITGSTNGHLAPRDAGRVLVPRLKPEAEKRIGALVAESLSKRVESERLLAQAKQRVEELIEQAVK